MKLDYRDYHLQKVDFQVEDVSYSSSIDECSLLEMDDDDDFLDLCVEWCLGVGVHLSLKVGLD